jgi:hypothetical protein
MQTLDQAGKACQAQTLALILPIYNLQKKSCKTVSTDHNLIKLFLFGTYLRTNKQKCLSFVSLSSPESIRALGKL